MVTSLEGDGMLTERDSGKGLVRLLPLLLHLPNDMKMRRSAMNLMVVKLRHVPMDETLSSIKCAVHKRDALGPGCKEIPHITEDQVSALLLGADFQEFSVYTRTLCISLNN